MANDLHSLCVLVTRPDPAGAGLCRAIEARGGRFIHFPTIAFVPPKEVTAFEQAVSQLAEQDWLIFISPQSVYASVPAIRRAWPHFPDTVRFACIGEGTAMALREAGYQALRYPSAEWSSDGLLALPDFQEMAGKRAAVIRGEGGREVLENVLSERGARVLSVIAYQRVLPAADVLPCVNLLAQHEIDVVISTSFDGVKNLKLLIGEAGWSYLKMIPLIVMSERIKVLAENLGFQAIWITPAASQDAMLDLIAHKKDELCRNRKNRIKSHHDGRE